MDNKRIIYIVRFMAFLIALSMTYYVFFRPGETIYVQSYDREHSFVLAEYHTERLIEDIDIHSNQSLFLIKDEDDFINEYVLTHPSYIRSYQYQRNAGDEEYTVYYFIEDGYGFYLSKDLNSLYSLSPSVIQIYNEEVDVLSQFIPATFVNINEHYNFEDMNTEEFTSFEDYVDFYQQLSCICSDIDEENRLIRLRSYNYDDHEVDSSYQIVLEFDDEGFVATIEEIQ